MCNSTPRPGDFQIVVQEGLRQPLPPPPPPPPVPPPKLPPPPELLVPPVLVPVPVLALVPVPAPLPAPVPVLAPAVVFVLLTAATRAGFALVVDLLATALELLVPAVSAVGAALALAAVATVAAVEDPDAVTVVRNEATSTNCPWLATVVATTAAAAGSVADTATAA